MSNSARVTIFYGTQGTWTTVGYARQAERRIWLVFPDGTLRAEEPAETFAERAAYDPY